MEVAPQRRFRFCRNLGRQSHFSRAAASSNVSLVAVGFGAFSGLGRRGIACHTLVTHLLRVWG